MRVIHRFRYGLAMSICVACADEQEAPANVSSPRKTTAGSIVPAVSAGTGAPSVPVASATRAPSPSRATASAASAGNAAPVVAAPTLGTAGAIAPPTAATNTAAPMATPSGGRDPSMLPTAKEPCPMMVTGSVMMLGIPVNLTVGPKSETSKGPIYIAWGGGAPNGRDEILAQGGVIAAIMGSNKQGTDTGNGTWFTGDYETADQVVACAVEQLNVDVRRIWTGGHSSGGLQAGNMAIIRSGYLAAAVPSSGGISPRPGLTTWQDPNHAPSVMTMHGAMGKDVVVIEFATASLNLDMLLAAKGGFAIDCDHGGGHEGPPPPLRAAAWEFLKAHPFGVDPKPYAAGLPANFPSYCRVIE